MNCMCEVNLFDSKVNQNEDEELHKYLSSAHPTVFMNIL